MTTFESALEAIMRREQRYSREGYIFVQMALDFYRRKHAKANITHLSGQELLQGVKELALDQFGPLAPHVLNHWGLYTGEDVGEIVYLFLEHGVMNKSDSDRQEDFAEGVKFDDSMGKAFQW